MKPRGGGRPRMSLAPRQPSSTAEGSQLQPAPCCVVSNYNNLSTNRYMGITFVHCDSLPQHRHVPNKLRIALLSSPAMSTLCRGTQQTGHGADRYLHQMAGALSGNNLAIVPALQRYIGRPARRTAPIVTPYVVPHRVHRRLSRTRLWRNGAGIECAAPEVARAGVDPVVVVVDGLATQEAGYVQALQLPPEVLLRDCPLRPRKTMVLGAQNNTYSPRV